MNPASILSIIAELWETVHTQRTVIEQRDLEIGELNEHITSQDKKIQDLEAEIRNTPQAAD